MHIGFATATQYGYSTTRPPKSQVPAAAFDPQECARLQLDLNALIDAKIQRQVERLAGKLVAKGLVREIGLDPSSGRTIHEPVFATAKPSLYQRARELPGAVTNKVGNRGRRALGQPRETGSKAFGEPDKISLTGPAVAGSTGGWAAGSFGRGVCQGLTTRNAPDCQLPAGSLEGLATVSGVVAGCTLLDSLDSFNTYLDTLSRQDRWKVEVVVFYRHYLTYIENHKQGKPSPPHVTYGFRRCQQGLSNCALFDKEARQALRRCRDAALRDSAATPVNALLSLANMGMKVHAGANLAAVGLSGAGMALGVAGLPLTAVCAGLDIKVGLSELRTRKKEYAAHSSKCELLCALIAAVEEKTGEDGKIFSDILKGSHGRFVKLKHQARREKFFARMRIAKGIGNAALTTPLTAVAVLLASLVVWYVSVIAAAFGAFISAAYLISYLAKAWTRERLRSGLRSDAVVANGAAARCNRRDRATTLAQGKGKGNEEKGLWSVVPQGQYTGGLRVFAGMCSRKVDPARNACAALDEFCELLARRSLTPPAARDPEMESAIKLHLAITAGIDERLFDDIERMITSDEAERHRAGCSERDNEWLTLLARRGEYHAAFALSAPPPAKLAPGALLSSYEAACWITRLSGSSDTRTCQFVELLKRNLKGEQVPLESINRYLHTEKHLEHVEPLTTEQMWAAADLLFKSVPPQLFLQQMEGLQKGVAHARKIDAFEARRGSPALLDLEPFCKFVSTRWSEASIGIGEVVADKTAVKQFSDSKLSAVLRHLESGQLLPDELTRRSAAWNEVRATLRNEWRLRFRGAMPPGLSRHRSIPAGFDGAWQRTAAGDYHHPGRQGDDRVAVIPREKYRKWVETGDWTQPLPVELRHRDHAINQLSWLDMERAQRMSDLPVLPSLAEISERDDASRDLLVEGDARPASPYVHGQLRSTKRVLLTDLQKSLPESAWGRLERVGSGRWVLSQMVLENGTTIAEYDSVEAAVQAYCHQHRLDRARLVFFVDPPAKVRPGTAIKAGAGRRKVLG
ncbi:hypothetical protein [Rhizobacter sp. P5_C2]